jgi:hypothetical protein
MNMILMAALEVIFGLLIWLQKLRLERQLCRFRGIVV